MDKMIVVTAEELRAALEASDLIMPVEVEGVYRVMLDTPAFGVRVAGSLQSAARLARTPEQKARILDAAVLPAFLVGVLVGREQARQGQPQSPPTPETATETGITS